MTAAISANPERKSGPLCERHASRAWTEAESVRLAEACAIGVPAAVGTQSGDTDVGANGQVVDVVPPRACHRRPPRCQYPTPEPRPARRRRSPRPRSRRRVACRCRYAGFTPSTAPAPTPRQCAWRPRAADVDPAVNTVTRYRPSGGKAEPGVEGGDAVHDQGEAQGPGHLVGELAVADSAARAKLTVSRSPLRFSPCSAGFRCASASPGAGGAQEDKTGS